MHKNKTTQKGGGDLQLTLQVKTYKPQTNSLNKHYPQKCKTKNKHTKGRGVGNPVPKAIARLVELINTFHLMLMFMFQQPAQENAYEQDHTRGKARTLDENLNKTTHRNKIGQGEGGKKNSQRKEVFSLLVFF